MEERLLTAKEASQILNISEDKVKELAEKGQIPAYKIGGIYLRFKREQIERLKDRFILPPKVEPKKISLNLEDNYTFFQKVKDFFYFYDFYILCFLIILLLLILIFKG